LKGTDGFRGHVNHQKKKSCSNCYPGGEVVKGLKKYLREKRGAAKGKTLVTSGSQEGSCGRGLKGPVNLLHKGGCEE